MDNERLVHELLAISDIIKELTTKKHRIDRRWSQTGQAYSDVEYELYDSVWRETDDKGKAKYSNEERRHREVAYRLRRDAKAREVSKVFDEIRDEEREVVAEINRLQDKKIILLVALGAPLPGDIIDLEEDKKYPF